MNSQEQTGQRNEKTDEDGKPATSYKRVMGVQKETKFTVFADDVMCTIRENTLYELINKMEETYSRLETYTSNNKLKLNSDKTHFMVLISPQRRQFYPETITAKFGENVIMESATERCLGMRVTNVLCDWGNNICVGNKSIISKCGALMRDLRKNSKYFTFKRRLNIGKSLVMSTMLYGIELYGPAAIKHQLEVLQSSQNQLVKWICQRVQPSDVEEDRVECGILSVYQLVVLRVLKLGLTVLHTGKPANLYNSLYNRPGGGEEYEEASVRTIGGLLPGAFLEELLPDAS